MEMSISIHPDPTDRISGDVASAGTLRNYGVLKIDKDRGYGHVIVFLGDNPRETRETVRKLRAALSDIIRALPHGEFPES